MLLGVSPNVRGFQDPQVKRGIQKRVLGRIIFLKVKSFPSRSLWRKVFGGGTTIEKTGLGKNEAIVAGLFESFSIVEAQQFRRNHPVKKRK